MAANDRPTGLTALAIINFLWLGWIGFFTVPLTIFSWWAVGKAQELLAEGKAPDEQTRKLLEVIDPELIERALQVSGEKTKKAAVSKALEEFIARREQRKLLELFGSLEWDSAYDYKAERNRR